MNFLDLKPYSVCFGISTFNFVIIEIRLNAFVFL